MNQIGAYKRMVEKEMEEIKMLKQQIQKKGQNISKTGGGQGSQAVANWADDNVSSGGKKFKFMHVIVISILFLLLGSFLATMPIAANLSSGQSSDAAAAASANN